MKSTREELRPDGKYPDLLAGWETRLLDALTHTRTHGTFGENSPLGRALIDIGIEPPARHRRVDWLAALKSGKVSLHVGDFYRYGLPLIARFVLSFLESNEAPDQRVFADVDAAVEAARRTRKEKREFARAKRQPEQSRMSPPGDARLSVHIDSALALLEGAVASHNLTGRQRTRLAGVVERLQASIVRTRQHGSLTGTSAGLDRSATQTAGSSVQPEGDHLDATRSWATAIRDNGRFGSHAAFDAMDDESSA